MPPLTARVPSAYWSLAPRALFDALASTPTGLSSHEAEVRLREVGPNRLRDGDRLSRLRVLGAQLRNPLLLLLVVAAAISLLTGEWVDAAIVLTIVVASLAIGASREYGAQAVVAALRSRVRTTTEALRDGVLVDVAAEAIVPGDVVVLTAGSLVPGDGLLLEAADLHVSQSVLTGESFPVPKAPGATAPDATLAERTNCLFMGTNVRSGTALCLIVRTGTATEFGQIAHRLNLRPPETDFERGIRHFGYLLTVAMLLLTLGVFAAHVVRGRPPVDTLLFAIALAVGLSPELLPAILSVNLARGAQAMAAHGVLVRHLTAIENLGSMDVLCTDKTGTLTEGVIRLDGSWAPDATPSRRPLELAAWNATLETGLHHPLDDAITQAWAESQASAPVLEKLAEIPFDAVRKRVGVVIREGAVPLLVVKGAFATVLEACERLADGTPLDDDARAAIETRFERWASGGVRVLAVATRVLDHEAPWSRDDETSLTFEGMLTFLDQPKAGAREAVETLAGLGVRVKLISGDSALVAAHVARLVGISTQRVVTGPDLRTMPQEALWQVAEQADVFAEVDPGQKERILLALRRGGHVVGFLGDGVNDAPAMHVADASLAVDQAVDVARAVADFVLLERDLDVIRRGIIEGRRTFANTLKYVLTTTSANLGNMVSMAAASLVLPFLPLLAGQILLNNFLSDVPAVGIADDSVDAELVARPERWDMRFIGRFMVEFGLLSSTFDVLTFVLLRAWFGAGADLFRTAWFVESLLTELLVALVVRTRRPFYRSRPGTVLLWSTVLLVPLSFAIPFLPYAGVLGFVPLPAPVVVALVVISGIYMAAAELGKRHFYAAEARRAH